MCSEVIAKQECDICEGLQKKETWETTNTQRMNQDFIFCQTEGPGENVCIIQDFPSSAVVKNLPAMQETRARSLDLEDPLENETATHSSILAQKIPRTEESGRLQSMGLQRVGCD